MVFKAFILHNNTGLIIGLLNIFIPSRDLRLVQD